MNNSGKYLTWAVLSVVGAFALGYIASTRGKNNNRRWSGVAAGAIIINLCLKP